MIERVGGPVPPRQAAVRSRSGERFGLIATDEPAPTRIGDVGSVALGGMLAMQEAEADAASDREARRDGEGLLRELAGLQRDLLGEGVTRAGLGRVADLAARARPAADKGLQGILDAIAVRARIELIRYGAEGQ
jgi:hypothetical protein